jgi:hypothetical protein
MFRCNMILVLSECLDFHSLSAFRIKADIYYSAILTFQAELILFFIVG